MTDLTDPQTRRIRNALDALAAYAVSADTAAEPIEDTSQGGRAPDPPPNVIHYT